MVDYTSQDFAKVSQGKLYDLIIDMMGNVRSWALQLCSGSCSGKSAVCLQDTEVKAYSLLADGGTFSHLANPEHTDPSRHQSCPDVWTKGRKWVQTIVQPNADQLKQARWCPGRTGCMA